MGVWTVTVSASDDPWDNFDVSVGGDFSWLNDGRPTFEEFLIGEVTGILNDAANACTKALSDAGLLDKLKKALKSVNIVSASDNPNVKASKYFSDANKNETLLGYLNRFYTASGAPVGIEKYARTSTAAILTLDGGFRFVSKFTETISTNFFLHEFVHYATGRTDFQLARTLGLKLPENATEADASTALSNYFNNGCK